MDLLIRSQDKEALKKINMGIMYWKNVNNRDCIVNIDNATGYSIMGAYETKERALEVLDEIQNILKPKYILDSSSIKPDGDSWVENGVILQNYNANARIEELSTYVYEMPEK